MAKKYNQYCPMSYSLDVIGGRWTLHIVRNLMYGALRFKDLQKGLPGIASNLLTKRLKELEAAGIIEQVTLPPPASISAYTLTEQGQELRMVIGALSQWGLSYLKALPPEEDFVSYVPFRGYLQTFFSAERANDLKLTCAIETGDYPFYVSIADQQIHTSTTPVDVDLYIKVNSLRILIGVLNRVILLEDAIETGQIILANKEMLPQLKQFVTVFDVVGAQPGE